MLEHDGHQRACRDWHIPDELSARLEPVLPPSKPHPRGRHRPGVDDRKSMDAILFVLRTGCQWNALNETGICSSRAAQHRFQKWLEAAVFQELWKSDRDEYNALEPAVCGPIRVTPVSPEQLIIEAASGAMQS